MAVDAARHLRRPERFRDTYWSRFHGKYFTGDGAKRDEDGYFWLLGRVDDIMNVSGHRISTTEVESALVDHPAVAEAAVIGKADDITGQAIAAFVILRSGNEPRRRTGRGAAQPRGRAHRADRAAESILFTDELPKTRSGKIMRRLLRDVARGQGARRHHDAGRPGRGRAASSRAISDRAHRGVKGKRYLPEHWTWREEPLGPAAAVVVDIEAM